MVLLITDNFFPPTRGHPSPAAPAAAQEGAIGAGEIPAHPADGQGMSAAVMCWISGIAGGVGLLAEGGTEARTALLDPK